MAVVDVSTNSEIAFSPGMKKPDWDKRIRRAAQLAERYPGAAEVLTFYRHILVFQQQVYDDISSRSSPPSDGISFRARLDPAVALKWLPDLLLAVRKRGPSQLGQEAVPLSQSTPERQQELLAGFPQAPETTDTGASTFFARVLFQPYAEYLAAVFPVQSASSAVSVCPVCGGKPQVAVLRPEGDGGKRFLVCSFCSTEWEFRRILCPVCEEVDHGRLPRYSAEDLPVVRVEACDTCHYYLKSVDMTIDGLAVPMVDEVATVSLDVWASEHGYRKISLNLMGF